MLFQKLTPNQVAALIAERTSGTPRRSLATKYGVSVQIIWKWMRYQGLDAKWLVAVKNLEAEVIRLGRALAIAEKQVRVGAAIIQKLEPSAHRRSLFARATEVSHGMCRSRANGIVGLSRHAGQSPEIRIKDHQLLYEMRRYFDDNPGVGFRSMFSVLLEGRGCTRNHALNLYQKNRLEIRYLPARPKLPKRVRTPRYVPGERDALWSMDFMADHLRDGGRFWVLNCVDVFSRECIFSIAMRCRSAKAVVAAMDNRKKHLRKPAGIQTDNGGEFTSKTYQSWCAKNSIDTKYIRPGHPEENAFIERFNGSQRREILRWYLFDDLAQAQRALNDWCTRYNYGRPHVSLGGLSPIQYAELARLKSEQL